MPCIKTSAGAFIVGFCVAAIALYGTSFQGFTTPITCPEDSVIAGTGDFDGRTQTWQSYECVPRDDLAHDRVSTANWLCNPYNQKAWYFKVESSACESLIHYRTEDPKRNLRHENIVSRICQRRHHWDHNHGITVMPEACDA